MTADIHLAENPRDEYRLRWFEALPTLVREQGASRVLVLGDITETKDGHRAPLVNRIVDGFAALAAVAHVYVLKGNHDYVAEDVPFYRFLRHLPRVRWINEPTPLTLQGLGRCLFLPHARTPDDWEGLLSDPYEYCFCHQTFVGADVGGRAVAGGAFHPGIFRSRSSRVVSGDVHVPQAFGRVTYVGAPYTIDFGDQYVPRVLLLEGKEMTSIAVEGPQKRLIEIDSVDKLPTMKTCRPGDIVKVRMTPETGECSRAAARQTIREWAQHAGVALSVIQIKGPDVASKEDVTARRARQRPDEELIWAYAKKMGKGKATVASAFKIMEESA